MNNKIRCLVSALFAFSMLMGCSNNSIKECDNVAGTWQLVVDIDDHSCNGLGQRFKQVFVVNQNQCQLSIDGGTTGTISQGTIAWSLPSVQMDGGTLTYSSAYSEISNKEISGAYDWQWSNGGYSCSGVVSAAGHILTEQQAANAKLGEFAMQVEHPLLEPSEGALAHTFTLEAKGARQVYLAGEMSDWRSKVFVMQPSGANRWSITLYLKPGAWQYKFVIDGAWVADQQNPQSVPDGHGGVNSVLVIGEENPLLKAQLEIAHGNFVEAEFKSDKLNQISPYAVYLPPNYQTSGIDYPVLVLLHGYGQDYKQWIVDGKIQHLMDNMIADKSIEPFIVLMPSAGTSYYQGKHESFIMQELLPHLAEQYKVESGSQYSAISGTSMGGAGAFYLAHKYPKQFGLSLPLSGYFDMEMYPSFSWQNFTLDSELVLYCGEDDSISYLSNQRLVEQLNQQGVEFSYLTAEGGHTWRYWNSISEQVLKQVSSFFAR
ncbi:alpha/beta hydrolase-fold protein [Agarivorans sp. Alg241-V36]|uniref:alpha/beta hydrolase-fold protein n=1 Tax=Agarivorans sp. Alg241-V36 TaxID=2305992 RepID=UPI0013CFA206|nr:alpha/beta hydrolase-fold protein [Agarivorans sp. Alg241-V36]